MFRLLWVVAACVFVQPARSDVDFHIGIWLNVGNAGLWLITACWGGVHVWKIRREGKSEEYWDDQEGGSQTGEISY